MICVSCSCLHSDGFDIPELGANSKPNDAVSSAPTAASDDASILKKLNQ